MIDIHTHLMYGVDDGPRSLEESVQMLWEAKQQGVTKMILTPHYRKGMFKYPRNVIEKHFQVLQKEAKTIGIQLYLGCEFHANHHIIDYLKNGRCLPMADSPYVLTEFTYETEYSRIVMFVQKLIMNGYNPIIAHVERYGCFLEDPERVREIAHLGAMIQVNADSVLGHVGWKAKGFCKYLLKNEWVDFVGSDSHGMKNRPCNLQRCEKYIAKKYGKIYAQELFLRNPNKILEWSKINQY